MYLKFILLGSFCYMLDGSEICPQYVQNPVKSGSDCAELAGLKGMSIKSAIEELGGSMTHYKAQCIAIDQEGWNVDYTFNISYNIS